MTRPVGNGIATAGLVVGIIGVLLGTIPLLAFFALILGVLGLVFGIIGWRRVSSGRTESGKGMSIAAILLGIGAIILAFIGFAILADVFADLEQELEDLGSLGAIVAAILLH